MSNKKSKRAANVRSSILVLLLIAILLIASTYAWFTSNRVVTISSIDVHVEASSGIQISVDGINWKTVISNSDITAASDTYSAAVNQLPATMVPVSTAGVVSGDRMAMYYGVVTANETTGNYELTATAETDANGTSGKYVAFDVFLKLDQAETIYLTEGSDVTHQSTTAAPSDKGLKNAARVGFCVLGNTNSNSTTQVIQGLTGGTTSYIWEPNYDVHTQAGVNAASSIYGITTSLTGGSQLSYYGVKAPISTAVALNNTSNTLFTSLTNPIKTAAGHQAGTVQLMSGSAGITKVRIYMWIEGQDVDCENSASGSDIRFDLGFTIDPST